MATIRLLAYMSNSLVLFDRDRYKDFIYEFTTTSTLEYRNPFLYEEIIMLLNNTLVNRFE